MGITSMLFAQSPKSVTVFLRVPLLEPEDEVSFPPAALLVSVKGNDVTVTNAHSDVPTHTL